MTFNTLVMLALALLVMVSVGIFFIVGQGKLGDLFTNFIGGQTRGAELQSARAECTQLCMSLNNFLANKEAAKEQPYCTRIFKLADDGDPNDNDHCYDSLLTGGTSCEATLSDGTAIKIDKNACSSGGAAGVVTQ